MIILANPKRETDMEASTYHDTAMSVWALLLSCNNSIISMQQANKLSLVSLAVCSYFGRASESQLESTKTNVWHINYKSLLFTECLTNEPNKMPIACCYYSSSTGTVDSTETVEARSWPTHCISSLCINLFDLVMSSHLSICDKLPNNKSRHQTEWSWAFCCSGMISGT